MAKALSRLTPHQSRPPRFAALVRAWRSERQLSRADAARKLGVPYRTLEDWEAGKRTPRGIAKWLILDQLGKTGHLKKTNRGITRKTLNKLLVGYF